MVSSCLFGHAESAGAWRSGVSCSHIADLDGRLGYLAVAIALPLPWQPLETNDRATAQRVPKRVKSALRPAGYISSATNGSPFA